jgi:single-strand DNA-binding protein
MASVNHVQILGNVGKDPELRYSTSGTAFCTLSIATNRSWKDKESGEKREEVEFHRVNFNDRLAEIVGEYVKKGKQVYVMGRLKTRKWQDKEGRDTYTTEIIASELQLLGGKDEGAATSRAPAPAPRSHGDRPGGPKNRPAPAPSTRFDDMDSDIPF